MAAQWNVQKLFWAVGVLVALVALTGCNSPTNSYLLNGIGAELPAPDVVSSTKLQKRYFNYLCKQAGLPTDMGADGTPHCSLPLHDRGMWTLIVYQGMNDIDRRCDAYLQWLDNKKRSREPLLSQISTVRTATEAIIGFSGGNAVAAINIVGQAFQLLTDSVENYHSRLLLEVDSSTVNSIVIRGRHKFRQDIKDRQFQNRPEAEHVLRSYLRLCLPFAIETNINDYSTLGSLGVSPEGGNTINQAPVVGTQVIGAGGADGGTPREFDSSAPSPVDPNVTKPIAGSVTTWEKALLPDDLETIQKYLCIKKPAESFGEQTRAGILLFKSIFFPRSKPQTLSEKEGAELLKRATENGQCKTEKYANLFERQQLSSDALVKILRKKLNEKLELADGDKLDEDKTDIESARDAIEKAYEKFDIVPSHTFLKRQVTKELLDNLQSPS